MDDGITHRLKKVVYIALGTIILVLAFLGLFLPVLPTTPLVILAAACYYRGSERLHAWLLGNRWFGETIKNYRAGRGLKRNTKIRAIGLMWIVIIISTVFYVKYLPIKMVMYGIAFAVSIYLVKLPTYGD